MEKKARDQSLPEHVRRATSYVLAEGARNTSRAGSLREGRWKSIVKYNGHPSGIALVTRNAGVTKRHLAQLERQGQLLLNTSPSKKPAVDVAQASKQKLPEKQSSERILLTYRDVLLPEETAVALFTDGTNLTIRLGGVSESGRWKIADGRSFQNVIIYKKAGVGGEIYAGDFVRRLNRPKTDEYCYVQFSDTRHVGNTAALWTDFTEQPNGRAQRVYLPRQVTLWTDPSEEDDYSEGTSTTVTVNRYERDPKARARCIEHFGAKCAVCNLRFERRYGKELGKGFIHVHHIVPLASIGTKYKVDPIKDLVPVCPNCHAMLHRGDLLPKVLRKLLKTSQEIPPK